MATDLISCSIDGCNNRRIARGFCNAHYKKWKKYGDPNAMLTTPKGEPLKYFNEVVLHFSGDECLIWPYATYSNGYGEVRFDGLIRSVHRLACEIINGPAPYDKPHAAHACGNGHLGCVNPRHISWKSHGDNMIDMIDHGTSPRGIRNAHSKLTEDDVKQIRYLRGAAPQYALAEMFGVSQATICNIHLGKVWSWILDANHHTKP